MCVQSNSWHSAQEKLRQRGRSVFMALILLLTFSFLLPVCRWSPSCPHPVSTFLKTCNPFQPFNLLTFNFIRSHRARPPGRSGNARQTRCFQPFNFFFKRFTRFNLFNFFNRYFNPGPRPKPEAEARLVSTFNFFQRYSFQPLTFSNVYSFSTL